MAGLAALSFLSFGFAALIAGVGLVGFGIIAFHYLIWGWWLGNTLEREEQEES